MAITFSRFTRTGTVYMEEQADSWLNGTIKALLIADTHTFDPAHEFVNDVTADEVSNDSGTGYERKTFSSNAKSIVTGATVPDLAGGTVSKDILSFTADALEYTDINTIERIVGGYVYAEITNDTDSKLLWQFLLDNPIPSDVTTLPTVNINGGTLGFGYKVIN